MIELKIRFSLSEGSKEAAVGEKLCCAVKNKTTTTAAAKKMA